MVASGQHGFLGGGEGALALGRIVGDGRGEEGGAAASLWIKPEAGTQTIGLAGVAEAGSAVSEGIVVAAGSRRGGQLDGESVSTEESVRFAVLADTVVAIEAPDGVCLL